MERDRLVRARRGMSAASVLLLALLVTWPAGLRVAGSVPTARSPRVALLESLGELPLASAALDSDTLLAPDPENLRARLRLECRRARWAGALQALEAHPGQIEPGTEALLRALLLARLGEPERCLEALSCAPAPEGLEKYAALVAAEAAVGLERWDEAALDAERASGGKLPREMMQRLRVVQGLVAQERNDIESLRRLAPELGDAARRDDRTGLLLLACARAAARAGQREQAHDWRLDLLEGRPAPAESAYADLQRFSAPELDSSTRSALRLARYETRSGRHTLARARLHDAIAAHRAAAELPELWMALAEADLRAGEPETCLRTLDRAAGDVRASRLEPERLRLRARASRRLGRNEAAMSSYRELARRFPSHPLADDALYEIGWLHEKGRALHAAERAYVRCDQAYPRGGLADDADLRAGLCALRDARPADAATHFLNLVTEHPRSTLADNALYWRMLSQIELGDASGALVLRDRLEREFPRSYFAVLARRRVERGLAATPESAAAESGAARIAPLQTDTGFDRAQRVHVAYGSAIASLRLAAGLQPPADFDAETRLWRFLLDFGLAVEASWEERRLEKRYDGDAGALLELLSIGHARGAHERLVRLAYLLSQRLPDAANGDAVETLLFPAPYACTLAEVAARHGLSHATVLGLMRQESAFDPRIDSGAGARGLMQLMPEVGRRLANGAGRSEWHPDLLYDPEVNIELGCQLLAAELGRAHGDLPQALAAYNAGGDQAQAWAGWVGPRDPAEMYLDLAEYAETRTYLKNVLGNVETYRRLYALP